MGAGAWGSSEGGLDLAVSAGRGPQEGRAARRVHISRWLGDALLDGAGLQRSPFLWDMMQVELPGLSPGQLGPPGWPEESTVAQACQLSQGPCRSEHREQRLLPSTSGHSVATGGGRTGAGGQERDLRSASAEPSEGEREQVQARSAGQCQPLGSKPSHGQAGRPESAQRC